MGVKLGIDVGYGNTKLVNIWHIDVNFIIYTHNPKYENQ
jgi:hypothetical protein